MNALVTRCCVVLAAACVVLAPTVPAQADTETRSVHGDAMTRPAPVQADAEARFAPAALTRSDAAALVLTVTPQRGPASEVTLTCAPAGGTHPNAEDACAKLAAAGGDFLKLQPTNEGCTLEYSPVRVHVAGVWHGGLTDFVATYSNRCVAITQTDGILDF
ncbi:SSI family serine proteinase inhibitor [Longispora sp. NPDC051575]|uniref:SSI family serine proteinase inhibitor n=1 Tax=Longispora sp. NPDC051575 TaxID=3154943 RepID=UPI00341898A7